MKHSEGLNELGAALAKAQGEMTAAKKDGSNPFFKSRFATLGSVWDAARGPLSRNGLSVIQTTDSDEKLNIAVVSILLHSSGQWMSGALPIMNQKQDPQSIGSAISYARRYALMGLLGIASEDDDGEGAMTRSHASPKPRAAAEPEVKASSPSPIKTKIPSVVDLFTIGGNNGWTPDDIRDHMKKKYNKDLTKDLTEVQLIELSKLVSARKSPLTSQAV